MDHVRFTAELMEAEGLTMHNLLKACRDGDWERLRRGAYVRGGAADGEARHLLLIAATMPMVGEASVVSHASAGVLHGLPVPHAALDRVWITRSGSGHGRRGPVVHLRRCQLDAEDVMFIGGIPVTTPARTAIDLARASRLEWGVIACDAAMTGGAERTELLEVVDRMRGWPGVRRAERAAHFADPGAESPLESVSRLQISRLRFPSPVVQFPVLHDGVLVATSDFGWEDPGLVGECDGKVKYDDLLRPGETPADAVMREKRREERIRGAGYWISRWGWADAWHPPTLKRILDNGFACVSGSPRPAG